MKNIKSFFIILIFKYSFSLLCINSTFDQIFPNLPKYFQVQYLKEACFKYKLPDNKNLISLTFSVAKSYTAEVLIYKAKNLISMDEGNYINFEEKYFIIDNTFKEINVKDYYDYIYIIIRDSKNYFFYDNIILFDSELPIILEANKPIEINHFMKNNKYIFNFYSEKNLQFVYGSKINARKLINIEYDGNKIIDQQIDNNDYIINLNNENLINKLLKIIIENKDEFSNDNNQDFSLIIYEKDKEEFIEIKKDQLTKFNYIKNNLVQNFYFFCDISEYIASSTINFLLDFNNKINKYINIISDIIYSDIILQPEDFIDLIPLNNKLEYSYDIDSDEILKIYFNVNEKNHLYKYIIIKLEIKDRGIYYNPKYFTISLSKQIEEINLKNIEEYHTEIRKLNSIIDVPNYYKFNLNSEYKYLFSVQNQDYMTLIAGDLLVNSLINKNYIDNKKDINIISDTSELTLQISDIELNNENIYIEKIISEEVIIIENERKNTEIKIIMTQEYCNNSNKKKYLLGSYDKDKYGNKALNSIKYWMSGDGEIELYFKNNIDIDKSSIFPSSEKYKILPFTAFNLDTNIDLFTFTCSKPGTLLIKPLMKSFKEKTHIITQNSITFISLNSKEEILQLTTPLKLDLNCDKYLYLSIQAIQENNDVIITPDTNGVFKESKISENQIIFEKIDINKYKSNDLAIKIISDAMADIEVIEVIHYKFSEYYNIENEQKNKINKNNFVKFIKKESKKIQVNINGLNQVPIYYSLVKLASNDINYIPLVYNFKNNFFQKNCSQNEIIEIENKFNRQKDDIKEYIAFIFSIKSFDIIYEYDVQIKEIKDNNESIVNENSWKIILVVIFIFILIIVIVIYIRKRKKSKIIDIESINNSQALFPNKKYILNDILNKSD